MKKPKGSTAFDQIFNNIKEDNNLSDKEESRNFNNSDSQIVRKSDSRNSENTETQKVEKINKTRAVIKKSFFVTPEIADMFKYLKWKRKISERDLSIKAFEDYFTKEFGKDWRKVLSES